MNLKLSEFIGWVTFVPWSKDKVYGLANGHLQLRFDLLNNIKSDRYNQFVHLSTKGV